MNKINVTLLNAGNFFVRSYKFFLNLCVTGVNYADINGNTKVNVYDATNRVSLTVCEVSGGGGGVCLTDIPVIMIVALHL